MPPAIAAQPGLRHLLPGRPASASASLSCRMGSWEDEVKAVGSPLARSRADEAGAPPSPPAQKQQQQQQEQQHYSAAGEHQQQRPQPPPPGVPRTHSTPAMLDRSGARGPAPDAGSPQLHLRVRLAGVAAAAAAQAEEAANGGTPTHAAVAACSPGADRLGALALGTPTAQSLAPHPFAQQPQALPAAAGAFGGTGQLGRAPSGAWAMGGALFSRQASLGLQEALPFEWDGGFGRSARPSNDDSGAFDALLGTRGA
jgi:hypothetical protein